METNYYKASFLLFILVALGFAPFSSLLQNLSIEGEIGGSSNRKVYLSLRDAGTWKPLDSTVAVNDRFAFTHQPKELNIYTITVEKVRGAIVFVWDRNVQIEGETKAIWQSRVSGSPLTEQLRKYNEEFTDPGKEKIIALSNSKQEPNLTPERRAELNEQQRDIVEALDRQAEKYIRENPNSVLSLFLLNSFWTRLGANKTKEILGTHNQELQAHSIAKAIQEEINLNESVNAGKPAPDFTARDLNGKEITLSNLKGQFVLLDFWGSWCGPCIRLIPETKEAFKRYQGKKVRFVGVAFDEEKDRAKLNGLIQKHGIAWPQIFQDMSDESKSQVVQKYLVHTYPSVIIINPEGDIIYRGTGQDGLTEACKVLDKELLTKLPNVK